MRGGDVRSRRVAVIADRTLNAHLSGNPTDRALMAALERRGFGVIQLPPEGVAPAAAEAAVSYVIDQVQDYLKNGYAVLDASPPGAAMAELFRSRCRLRGIALPPFAPRSRG